MAASIIRNIKKIFNLKDKLMQIWKSTHMFLGILYKADPGPDPDLQKKRTSDF